MQPANWNSSLLSGAAYDSCAAQLELVFRSGAIYCYFGVPAQTYHELLQAESKGRYFNSHVRNRFACSRIDFVSRAPSID